MFQYWKPVDLPLGPPPAVITIDTIIRPRKQMTLIEPAMTSVSPKNLTLIRLMARINTRATVMTTAWDISLQ